MRWYSSTRSSTSRVSRLTVGALRQAAEGHDTSPSRRSVTTIVGYERRQSALFEAAQAG